VKPTICGKLSLLESDAQTGFYTFRTNYDRKDFAVMKWKSKKSYNEIVYFAGSHL
jgi:hypothetical protein